MNVAKLQYDSCFSVFGLHIDPFVIEKNLSDLQSPSIYGSRGRIRQERKPLMVEKLFICVA